MLIQHATISKPSRTENDDLAGHAGCCFWLMDGATQLHRPVHGLTAAWHVAEVDKHLRVLLADDPEADLAVLAQNAITQTGKAFYAQSGRTAADEMMERPFCTLVLCRLNDSATVLEYLVLCDSHLQVVTGDRVHVISDTRLDELDALQATNALLQEGVGFDSAAYKESLLRAYHHVFAYLNNGREGGWYAAAQDGSVVRQAPRGTLPVAEGSMILLMSDGFTRAVDTLDIYADWKSLADAVRQNGLQHILSAIRGVEQADADGQRYPRSSRHDDATALWVQL